MTTDKETNEAFANADTFYKSDKIFDEKENIKIGTEYLQYWIDKEATIEGRYIGHIVEQMKHTILL